MTVYDVPDEALIQDAARAICLAPGDGVLCISHEAHVEQARAALAALRVAGGQREAELRERIAAEIEAHAAGYRLPGMANHWADGVVAAARIARGSSHE